MGISVKTDCAAPRSVRTMVNLTLTHVCVNVKGATVVNSVKNVSQRKEWGVQQQLNNYYPVLRIT